MGTPLKNLSLLSPRILSPLTPKFLSVSGSKNSPSYTTPGTKRVHQSPIEFLQSPRSRNVTSDIKINVLHYSEIPEAKAVKDILFNTPVKLSISKYGLEKEKYIKVLGRGGFGKVIRAIYRDKTVAMKVVKDKKSAAREKHALHLSHVNVLRIFDVISGEMDYSMIIMEYIPQSKQLQTVIEDQETNLEEKLVTFSIDISNGLKYCHSSGILHLDIKPHNVLVCGNVCKICDFGNSVRVDCLEEGTFTCGGTALYTAPEILLGKRPTEKSDIYSLGILFWQIKTRRNPFENFDNNQEIMYKVVKCRLRPEMEIPDNAYSDLYHSCWESEPEKRPSINNILTVLSKMNCV